MGSLRSGAKKKGHYFVICGKKIKKEDVAHMGDKPSKIRRLDNDGVNTLYNEKAKAPADPNKKGAGVGFIEIAR